MAAGFWSIKIAMGKRITPPRKESIWRDSFTEETIPAFFIFMSGKRTEFTCKAHRMALAGFDFVSSGEVAAKNKTL